MNQQANPTTKQYDADAAWLRSEGYELPDGREIVLTLDVWVIFDKLPPNFRTQIIKPGESQYPGHLEDAQMLLWLCKLRAEENGAKLEEKGAKLLRGARRIMHEDRWEAADMASEWWNTWFIENGWRAHGAQHFQAIGVAQAMIGDILGAVSAAATDNQGGDSGEDEMGK